MALQSWDSVTRVSSSTTVYKVTGFDISSVGSTSSHWDFDLPATCKITTWHGFSVALTGGTTHRIRLQVYPDPDNLAQAFQSMLAVPRLGGAGAANYDLATATREVISWNPNFYASAKCFDEIHAGGLGRMYIEYATAPTAGTIQIACVVVNSEAE